MRNGQLKPGYNIQIGTENGFVIDYASFSNPTDTKTLLPFLERIKEHYGFYPKNYVADKGYGSEENYQHLEERGVEAYIKYSHWEQEKQKRSKKYRFKYWNFEYKKETDSFVCPEGKWLEFEKMITRYKPNGAKEQLRRYRARDCHLCAFQEKCTKGENRSIEFNPRRYELQQKARSRLRTEKGWELYRKRGSEVETVFGQVKGNWGFRRFTTIKKQNIETEWGLNMLAYNLKGLAKRITS